MFEGDGLSDVRHSARLHVDYGTTGGHSGPEVPFGDIARDLLEPVSWPNQLSDRDVAGAAGGD